MLAYKTLEDGRAPFTGTHWPLPDGATPGGWVEAGPGALALCRNGVHACSAAQLPPWLGRELWLVELGGELIDAGATTVAARGRLVEPVTGWDEQARGAFGADCAVRAQRTAHGVSELQPVVDTVRRAASTGDAAVAGYWAAVVAGQRATGSRAGERYERAVAAERAAQADWLVTALGLIP